MIGGYYYQQYVYIKVPQPASLYLKYVDWAVMLRSKYTNMWHKRVYFIFFVSELFHYLYYQQIVKSNIKRTIHDEWLLAFLLSAASLSHAFGWLAADLSYISCHGPEGGKLLCQPWHSNITISQIVHGEDYMVHHAMTAKDSERQHLLAKGTAGSPIKKP